MTETITDWFENHANDYQTVLARLNATRDVLMRGPISHAADVLERSYVFAVLSIRTERDRHERAFTAHYAGELTLKEAALETVYGGNKKNWLRRTFEGTDWETLAMAVRTHARAKRHADLLDVVVDNLTGVAHRKAAFMLAMAGLHEFGCIDSNVARYADMGHAGDTADGGRVRFNSAEKYMETSNEIFDSVNARGDWPPFVKQWAIYDFERGEHARHMAFYREIPI